MLWVVVGTVIVAALCAAIAFQQRHEVDLVKVLTPLCGQQLDLAIAATSSKFGTIGEYTGVIDSVDPNTRWVSFEWIDWMSDGQLGTVSLEALSNGVIADCIRWVQPQGEARIDLV